MTDIIDETAGWPDVPLIATRDLVLGGPDGPSNKQAIALAARTELLRESTEFLGENQKRTPLYFDSYAEASAAVTLPDGQLVDAMGEQKRYRVEAGALVFVANLDQVRIDLSPRLQRAILSYPDYATASAAAAVVTPQSLLVGAIV